MILQALTQLYENLARDGKVPMLGWSVAKVSYALCLNDDGDIIRVIPLFAEEERGKKKVLVPQLLRVPEQVKRASGVNPNFLCDHSGYVLGVDAKGNPQRTRQCFEAFKTLHSGILQDVDSAAARALLAFLDRWDPETASAHPVLTEYFEKLLEGGNIVFRYQDQYLHEDEQVRATWKDYREQEIPGSKRICLVTGNDAPVAVLHPAIKGVKNAQSSGASLISYNMDAACSFNREQGMNAPVSEYAAYAYGTALNYLISDKTHVPCYVGDTLVLSFAISAQDVYRDALSAFCFQTESWYTESELYGMMKKLCAGERIEYEDALLDPEMDFYVLGIAPNAARLSVRFFMHNSFGHIIKNICAHYDRLEIERPKNDKYEILPLWRLLSETVRPESKDKAASPVLAGELLRAVLNDTLYPSTLLQSVVLRIRAERDIGRGKAAILKAYYLQNKHKDIPEEVLTVALNRECTDIPYVLGRLFAILEEIQEAATPGVNATIRDKYFNAASATPDRVFPVLNNLAEKHMKKIPQIAIASCNSLQNSNERW